MWTWQEWIPSLAKKDHIANLDLLMIKPRAVWFFFVPRLLSWSSVPQGATVESGPWSLVCAPKGITVMDEVKWFVPVVRIIHLDPQLLNSLAVMGTTLMLLARNLVSHAQLVTTAPTVLADRCPVYQVSLQTRKVANVQIALLATRVRVSRRAVQMPLMLFIAFRLRKNLVSLFFSLPPVKLNVLHVLLGFIAPQLRLHRVLCVRRERIHSKALLSTWIARPDISVIMGYKEDLRGGIFFWYQGK
jgi:hypothetical protein